MCVLALCMQRSEDNFGGSFPHFSFMGFRPLSQVLKLGSNSLYLLSLLIFSFWWEQSPGPCYSIWHHMNDRGTVPRGKCSPVSSATPLLLTSGLKNRCEKLANHPFSNRERPPQKSAPFQFLCIRAHAHTCEHKYALSCFVSSFIVYIQCI